MIEKLKTVIITSLLMVFLKSSRGKDCIEITKELNLRLQCVINIACTEKTIFERIKNRKYCEKCEKFFNDVIRPKNGRNL